MIYGQDVKLLIKMIEKMEKIKRNKPWFKDLRSKLTLAMLSN